MKKIDKYWWLWLFLFLGFVLILKKIIGFSINENLYDVFVLIKDFIISYFLIIISIYLLRREKELKKREAEVKKLEGKNSGYLNLIYNGASDYIEEERKNKDLLIETEEKMRILREEIPLLNKYILIMALIGCILQIICLIGQK
jgi:hypothetical protein